MNSTLRVFHPLENLGGNALSNNNKNALSNNNKKCYISEVKTSDNENDENNKKPSIKERNKKYLPIAKRLSHIIQSTKNIKHTPFQINGWTNEIRMLCEGNGVDTSRIKEVLKWYKINIGGEYIPVVESGHSFRMKFTKLEDAMKRQADGEQKKEEEEYDPYEYQRELYT